MKTVSDPTGRGRTPLALGVPAGLAVVFLLVPLAGVLARTPWGSLPSRVGSPEVRQALALSLAVSGWALLLSLVLGVPLAWLLARADFPGKALVRCLVMLPMVLPPTVAGVALLQGYGRRGVAGPWLEEWFGVTLPFSTAGAVVASAFVAMPFLVISLEGALAGLHPRYEETALSLGAAPLRVFRTVTLPMVAPGLLAGAALCWARALGEFGATITFAGNLPGETQTLPLQVYLLLQDDPEGATAVSLLLLAIATAVLLALRGRWLGAGTAARRGRGRGTVAEQTVPEAGAEARTGAASRTPARPRGEASGDTPPEEQVTAAFPGSPPSGDPADRAARADGSAHASPAGSPLYTHVTGATRAVLDVPPGTTVAVVGPNGAGKTTLLRALLGLTRRATAHPLRLGDGDLSAVPAHRRRIAWVPQDGALFPHLTALANTAYGLRAQGVPRSEARREARARLDELGIGHLAHRRPHELSGGQAQRVALARALAARPRLLLMDEPLAALDQSAKASVRQALRRRLAGFRGVCLLVTHDPVEAVSLADRVLVLEDGEVVQYAAPDELARFPRSPWAARMLGHNAWPGKVTAEGTLRLDDGTELTAAVAPPDGVTAALAVAGPEAVTLYASRLPGNRTASGPVSGLECENVWPGTVREVSAQGGRLRVLVAGGTDGPDAVAELSPASAAELRPVEGARVWVGVRAEAVTLVAL
ncbi:ABC transporter permease [Streptomyces sp. URMC 126]|uniref:ABC transporter permease n=1 Tax=Streptomyces sp. URMC 126 TaxID=3423401 RepID=UPI003F1E331F